MFTNDSKQKRIDIFEDTLYSCEKDENLKNSIQDSIKNQVLIKECDIIKTSPPRYETKAKIIVSKKRSFEAAMNYKDQKVCVHNFASATNAGGGVTRGSNAQEECLCRCSTLYPCISDEKIKNSFHNAHKTMLHNGTLTALYNDDCIYTPNITFFKSDISFPELLPIDKWQTVDIITCAAPNLRERPSNAMNPSSGKQAVKINNADLKALHKKRANRILDIAKNNGAEVIILGAFGCGAFQNPPQIVAEGILEAIKQHIYDFKVIEFAIYCSPRDSQNYEVFNRYFNF